MAAVSGRNIILGSLVALAAVFYQYLLKDVLFVTYGVGRQMQKISEFPYQCRKIHDRQIEACEDMWLDEKSRILYLACSDPMSRIKWMPTYATQRLKCASTERRVDHH
jgi:arylesterase / paraoxonase